MISACFAYIISYISLDESYLINMRYSPNTSQLLRPNTELVCLSQYVRLPALLSYALWHDHKKAWQPIHLYPLLFLCLYLFCSSYSYPNPLYCMSSIPKRLSIISDLSVSICSDAFFVLAKASCFCCHFLARSIISSLPLYSLGRSSNVLYSPFHL